MEFVLSHIFRLTVFLMAVATGLSWWLSPAPQPASKTPGQEDAWMLPALTAKGPRDIGAAIGGANLWGVVQEPPRATSNEPDWRFAGVAVNGAERMVMIRIGSQPVQLLKTGDILPGGARITGITSDHLCLSIDGKQRKLDLFQ